MPTDEARETGNDPPREVVCPLGPPKLTGRVTYAWCPECQHVRKNRTHCVLVDVYGWSVDA